MLARVVLKVEVDFHVSRVVRQSGGGVKFSQPPELAIKQLLGDDESMIVPRVERKVGKGQCVVRLEVVLVKHVLPALDGLFLRAHHFRYFAFQIVKPVTQQS